MLAKCTQQGRQWQNALGAALSSQLSALSSQLSATGHAFQEFSAQTEQLQRLELLRELGGLDCLQALRLNLLRLKS